ncbi:hypothetical protein VSDG_02507 [Cytospora chrysosperma]|uniref:Uncharacterized protein n=1 Tax=Cytospora chrysosperma TaxID=252740 RepID=A0A423WFD2_CYTCH|nr:hypothetical protein VSDG_02507 [Valsa sordida]
MGYPFIIFHSDDPFQSAFHLKYFTGSGGHNGLGPRFIGALALAPMAVSDWREQMVC